MHARIADLEAQLRQEREANGHWKAEHYAQAQLHTQYRREAKAEFKRNADDIEGLQAKVSQLQTTIGQLENERDATMYESNVQSSALSRIVVGQDNTISTLIAAMENVAAYCKTGLPVNPDCIAATVDAALAKWPAPEVGSNEICGTQKDGSGL